MQQTNDIMAKTKKSYILDYQIERYLYGYMSQSEETIFLKRLLKDSSLRRRAYLTALVIKAALQ